jgi:ferredoxin
LILYRLSLYLCTKFKIKKIIMAYKILDNCVACGTCINECPVGAISEGDIYVIDADSCVSCGSCAGACPNDAIVED